MMVPKKFSALDLVPQKKIPAYLGDLPNNHPLVMTNIANWKVTMLSIGKLTFSIAIFHSYISHNQRVHSNLGLHWMAKHSTQTLDPVRPGSVLAARRGPGSGQAEDAGGKPRDRW